MSPLPYRSHSILLVDDDPDALNLISDLVRRADPEAQIVTRASGRAALRYLRRVDGPSGNCVSLPALILLDLRMPTLNGFEVLRWIRKQPFLSGVRVVMLSASDADADIQRAMRFGADGFLIKFPNPACFASLIRQAVAGMTERDATIAYG